MTVNRAWNPRNHIFSWGKDAKSYDVIRNFLRGKARNLLCKSSGMSVLMAFHCKLETPIRAVIWRWLKKLVLSNHASAVSNGAQVKFSTELIEFSVVICGSDTIKLGWNEDQCGKNLATMNVRGKRAELYQTGVNQRSSKTLSLAKDQVLLDLRTCRVYDGIYIYMCVCVWSMCVR